MGFVLTPDWFKGNDVLIGIFSFLVLTTFFILCIKSYKISKKKKNFFYLGLGFLAIAIAQLAAIMTKVILYYDTTFTQQVGQMIVTYHIISGTDIFYNTGFFFHKLLTLLGIFILYKISEKDKKPRDLIIAGYFLLISALAGSLVYYIYHLTMVIFLILIIDNYYKIYKKTKNTNTGILIWAFTTLACAHFIFLLSKIGTLFVIADVIELASYIILLFLIIRILKFND